MSEAVLTPAEIVVVGAGMVAHRFVENLIATAETPIHVTVIGDEARHPYDRTGISGLLSAATPEALELDRSIFDDFRVRLIADDRVLRIDRAARTVMTRSRRIVGYDSLVLATGASAGSGGIEGSDLRGCFGYRTLEDMQRLERFVSRRSTELCRPLRGAVIGGGSLAIEAAGALQLVGVASVVVQHSDRLTSEPVVSEARGFSFAGLLEARGVALRTGSQVVRVAADASGAVGAVQLGDGVEPVELVGLAVGVHPRDELARHAAIEVDPLGGIAVDERGTTSDPRVFAIGDVACVEGRPIQALAPGYAMAEVAAARILGATEMSSPRRLVVATGGALRTSMPAATGSRRVRALQAV